MIDLLLLRISITAHWLVARRGILDSALGGGFLHELDHDPRRANAL